MRVLLIVWLGFLGIKNISSGQIVNIEDKLNQKDTIGWFGQIDVSLSFVRNSESVLSINGTGRIDYLRERSSNFLLANYRIVRSGASDDLLNDGFVHYRYGRKITPFLRWESFGQIQYNERLALLLRTLVGTGPRFSILDKGNQKIFWSVLYMYEYDKLSEGEHPEFKDHRLSMSVALKLQLAPNLTFASTSYYQPVLSDFADSRVSSINALNFQISGHLSFRVNFNATYDARIAKETDDVPSMVYSILNGLRWTF
ncbi:MAG: hypothetical protein DHS20C18_31010 [Saprospiraceae bacterium]|nr:MAG: hypothetical protein DHS20C18_31010 [Saprospiraceae bacterium]